MPVLLAAACRTAFTGIDGALAGWHPVDLAAATMVEAAARAGIDPAEVDEVWVGCAEPVGAQGADLARAAVLAAGWPDHVGGTVVDRAETSGLAALHAASSAVAAGSVATAVVVGVGMASVVPPGASALARTYGRPWGDGPAERLADRGGLRPPARVSDDAARAAGHDRAALHARAVDAHARRRDAAAPAIHPVAARPGERVAVQRGTPVERDEIRDDPDPDLAPMFDLDGILTAATFSPPADGATALVLTSQGPHRARLVGVRLGAGDPLDPIGGADTTVRRLLDRHGRTAAAIDRWEVAAPTAVGPPLLVDRLGLDPSLVNPDGDTTAVGDVGAAEELRLVSDGIVATEIGDHLCTVSAGPTGSAGALWHRAADESAQDRRLDADA